MQKLLAVLVCKYGSHFVNLAATDEREIELFIKSLRGVSGVSMISSRGNQFLTKLFVLGNTNKVEIAMRELLPRFNIRVTRGRMSAF